MTDQPHPAAEIDQDWTDALAEVLADPDQPRLVFQPLVDLRHGAVVGYETLARFDVQPVRSPDRWFAAAWERGLGPALEADVLSRAVRRLADLPPNTFLTVNVDPNALSDPRIGAVLDAAGRVDRLVLELTEHVAIRDHSRLRHELDRWLAAGAKLAVDDAGTGYSGLALLLALRPQFVKLDGALVSGLDRDPAKRALVQMLGEFTAHMDAWLLAEGIEEPGELAELVRLRVPLGQGWLLGRPAPTWQTALPDEPAHVIAELGDALTLTDRVAHLVEPVRTVPADAPAVMLVDVLPVDDEDVLVTVDSWRRPVALLRRGRAATRPLSVHPATTLRDAAARAVGRPAATRFDAIVCCDGHGALIGLVRVDRLVTALTEAD